MKLWATAAILAAVTFSGNAKAAESCANAETQAKMTECAGKDFNKADATLGATYKQVEQRLKKEAQQMKLLRSAERSWVSYRDAECNFQASSTIGGSIHPMIVASCKADLTKDRVKLLENFLKCEEGDTSCPVPPAQ